MARPYKYTEPHKRTRQLEGYNDVFFESEFLNIIKGLAIVKSGYSWDGASPKIEINGKFFGVPDGPNNECKEATYWHDVFYQYQPKGISRKQIDIWFLNDLKKSNWKHAKLYYTAVRLFGSVTWIIKKGRLSKIKEYANFSG
jgi:hypothetical protein